MSSEEIKQLLTKSPLFTLMDETTLDRIVSKFEIISHYLGQIIFKQGDPGDSFYIIYSGKARVLGDSPDGSKIAYIQFCGDENMDIFVANMDGTDAVNVTNHPAMDTFFDWFEFESLKGDVNDDTRIDLFDVLVCVNIILGLHQPDSEEFWRADFNDDGAVDILDIVGIIRIILEG